MNPQSNTVDLTLFVPCYNEETLITLTLDTVQKALSRFSLTYEVLIYDDSSRDQSVPVIRRYIQDHNLDRRFKLSANEINRGIGINYFRAAQEGHGKYFMGLSGDNAIPVDTICNILDLIGQADVIIPYVDTRLFNITCNSDSRIFFRRFVSVLFASLVRLISGHRVRYFNSSILYWREDVMKNMIRVYGLGYQAELLCSVLNDPAITYRELKFYNNDRTCGSSSAFKWRNIISVGGSLWRILRHRRFRKF